MSEELAISLRGVSKCFKRYDRPIDRLKELLIPGKSRAQEFWALRDIDLDVPKGQTLGIVGRNGSGKSTLLQIIAGTLTPTTGTVQVNGRVSALLELGSGFNPEFTGRQNVFFNGQLLGLTKAEVEERFDTIAAFADIGDFIDQPVKTYSSGMFVRLAFAVAVHVDPEILIIDEALAVGDMFFQAKCMSRMRLMIDNNVSVLFVSHDSGSVRALCDVCLLLENGYTKSYGCASDVVSLYTSIVHAEINQALKSISSEEVSFESDLALDSDFASNSLSKFKDKLLDDNNHNTNTLDLGFEIPEGSLRYGDGGCKILKVVLLNKDKENTNQLFFRESFTIQIYVRFDKNLTSFCVGYSFRDLKGQQLVGTVTTAERINPPQVFANDLYVIEISGENPLRAGTYTISVGIEIPVITNEQHILMDVIEQVVVFQSIWTSSVIDRFPAIVYVPTQFLISKLEYA